MVCCEHTFGLSSTQLHLSNLIFNLVPYKFLIVTCPLEFLFQPPRIYLIIIETTCSSTQQSAVFLFYLETSLDTLLTASDSQPQIISFVLCFDLRLGEQQNLLYYAFCSAKYLRLFLGARIPLILRTWLLANFFCCKHNFELPMLLFLIIIESFVFFIVNFGDCKHSFLFMFIL